MLLFITGCSSLSDRELSNKLLGMSKSKLYDCAGVPDGERRTLDSLYLTYEREILTTLTVLSCRSEINLKNDRVVSSKIRILRDNAFGAMRAKCSQVFAAC